MSVHVADPARPVRAGAIPPVVLALSGWECDGCPRSGAKAAPLLAGRAAQRMASPFVVLGEGGPAADLDWRASLARATPFLHSAAAEVDRIMGEGRRPAIFANRCAASLSTVAAALRRRPDAVVLWCDAHGGFHTPQCAGPADLGGMVLAALCGLWDSGLGAGLSPDRLVVVGAHTLDEPERDLIHRHGVRVIPSSGPTVDIHSVLDAVDGRPVWLHIDSDVIDPIGLPAAFRSPGGLHPATLARLCAALARTSEVVGLELTEFDTDAAVQDQAIAELLWAIDPVLDVLSKAEA